MILKAQMNAEREQQYQKDMIDQLCQQINSLEERDVEKDKRIYELNKENIENVDKFQNY